jgi:hypothetical protein
MAFGRGRSGAAATRLFGQRRRDRRAGVGDDGDDVVHLIVHDVAVDDPSK